MTVTGISGFVGSRLGLALIKDGYHVRGTVRDPNNEKKVKPIKDAFGEYFDKNLTLVKADLLDKASLVEAIKGSTHVAHVASPFIINEPKDEMELIKPAVTGTLNVMEACRENKVKRVVLTSSLVSIEHTHPNMTPDDDVFTETHWSDPERP